jgi:2-hydroxychromene-2-carboxylate isomerase
VSDRRATFYYDVSSPYAYLAAQRVDEILPAESHWQPIAFGALIQAIGKVPWSLRDDTRAAGQAEIAERARERGLPAVRWPPGWPAESYSVLPLRALLHAFDHGRGKELSLELYRRAFVDGVALDDPDVVVAAAEACGLDGERVRAAVAAPEIKARLRAATDEAMRRGVTGVPTIALDGELFWGDDRLEDAARTLAA